MKDAIIDTENGLLVEPGDVLAWSGAITTLANNEDARRNLGSKASQYTLTHYHWQGISKKSIEIIESLLQ